MKTGTKIVIGIGAAFALAGLFTSNKVEELKDTFSKMTMKIVDFSNLKGSLTNISFNIDLYLHNPTNDDFTVSGFGIASLKRLRIFLKGKYLGEASVNISEISIPSNYELIIHDLKVNVATSELLNNIMTITDIKLSDLSAVATFDVAGNEFEIATL